MARGRQHKQHEVLTPEVVQRLREATQRTYDKWWTLNFGHLDHAAWDRYHKWLLKKLPETAVVWRAIYE